MGMIVRRDVLAKASRARMGVRLTETEAWKDPSPNGDAEVGAIVHAESMLEYHLCDVPLQMRAAPWMVLIAKCKEEFGLTPQNVLYLSNSVTKHIASSLLKTA